MSVDLRTIEPQYRDILQNKNLIAINQDKLGIMGKCIYQTDRIRIWSKRLVNNSTAFVAFHLDPYGTPAFVSVDSTDLGLLPESFSGKFVQLLSPLLRFEENVNPSGGSIAFWAEPISQSQTQDSSFQRFKLKKNI
jgi:alpha-N-acetylgalactosaminidase